MTNLIRIAIGQLNFLVGDVHNNANKIIAAAKRAKYEHNADLIVFPELCLTGYPPEDLLLRPDLHLLIKQELKHIQNQANMIDMIIGYPLKTPEGIYNAAAYISHGQFIATYTKQHLPNYGVFDEKRYFIKGKTPCIVNLNNLPIGLLICEDLWQPGPCTDTVNAGARLIIVINASPYDMYKFKQREALVKQQTKIHNVPIIYAHCVGGQDELVFDGGSFATNASGNICDHAEFFQEKIHIFDVEYNDSVNIKTTSNLPTLSNLEHIYGALKLGVKDYIEKNKFMGALLGLSGGIDSALTLTIAVDALGANSVEVVLMPSQYTAQISIDDALTLAKNLGVKYHIIPIDNVFQSFLTSLQPSFQGMSVDKTEENIQARCRGIILMALSNKFGKVVLTTGNKSEMAVGYATLYGDMAGGFAVIKDVYKTLVYQLANYRNKLKPDIPQRIITRAPSAELAPNQKDEDTLPVYSILDKILELYIEQDKSLRDIVEQGFDEEMVKKIINMIDKSEYKRRQAPPGIRITRKAFGRERRYPITSGFRHDL